jgi:hypothetical protein
MNIPRLNPKRNNHDQYLENLIYHLENVGEDKRDVQWIMKDGIWQKDKNVPMTYAKLCDIISIYHSGYATPIELKGSKKQGPKAKEQILSGREFIEDVLKLPVLYGKLVVYSKNGYFYRKLNFDNAKWLNWNFYPF